MDKSAPYDIGPVIGIFVFHFTRSAMIYAQSEPEKLLLVFWMQARFNKIFGLTASGAITGLLPLSM
jgi:hypothetical protein